MRYAVMFYLKNKDDFRQNQGTFHGAVMCACLA